MSSDCLILAIKAQSTLSTHHLQYLFGSGYPLLVTLGTIFIAISQNLGFNDPVLAVNYVSVMFSSIAVVSYYLLIKKISDTLTAIIASMILLFNPIFLDVSTYGINHAPSLSFLLLGLLFLIGFQNSGKLSALFLSAILFGLMGAVRLQDYGLVFAAVCTLFFLGLEPKSIWNNQHKLQNFSVFIGITILVIVVFHLPYFLSDTHHYQHQLKDYMKSNISENYVRLPSSYIFKTFSEIMNNFTIVGIICFCAGIYYTFLSNRKLLAFSVVWMIPLFFYGNVLSIALSPRFLTITLPAFIIPASTFLAYLLKHNNVYRVIALFSLLMIILLPLSNVQETFVRRHNYDLISDYYNWVGKITEPKAIIISSDDELFIKYYSKRNTLHNPQGLNRLTPQELNDFQRHVNQILNNHNPLYITQLGLTAYDYDFEFWNFMMQHYHLKWVGKRPLEFSYQSPFSPQLHRFSLLKIEKKQ